MIREANCQECGELVVWYQSFMEAENSGWVHAVETSDGKWAMVSSDHDPVVI